MLVPLPLSLDLCAVGKEILLAKLARLRVEGVGIVVADVAAQYRSEAFHGETLVVEMGANDFNKYGCDLVWRLSDKASGREVARGKHGIMFFDYTARKATSVPPGFLAKAGA